MPQRKAKIIEAAKKSFSLFGFKGTTVDQIAKIAGVGKGTIYLYFENKEELLHEIVFSLVGEMKRLAADEDIASKKTLFERLHASIYVVLMYRKEHELMMKLAEEFRQYGTQAVQDAIVMLEDEVVAYIKTLLEKAIQAKSIKACDPEITAYLMYRMYVSLIFDWEKRHDPLSNEQISQLFQLYLMEGLAIERA